jgi:hypothetical protein
MVTRIQAVVGVTWVRSQPHCDASLESQLLAGEFFDVSETADGWAKGKCSNDGFPGFVELSDFSTELAMPSHAVVARVTPVLAEPFIHSQPTEYLSLGSAVTVAEASGRFLRWTRGGWIYKVHLAPWPHIGKDIGSIMKIIEGTPFVWGGRSAFGMDCSGFVQFALGCLGWCLPRDLPEQCLALVPCEAPDAPCDVVFLRHSGGELFHAGVLIDADTIAHAGRRFAGLGTEPLSRYLRRYDIDSRWQAKPAIDVLYRRIDDQHLRKWDSQ